MARVFYVPYATYEIKTELSKIETINLIRCEISNSNLFKDLTKKSKGRFEGAINMKTGKFRIRRRLNARDSFNPQLYGSIVEEGRLSTVKITIKLPPLMLIILIIICLGWIVVRLWHYSGLENHIITFGGLGLFYFFIFFGFNMGAGAALDSLHEML